MFLVAAQAVVTPIAVLVNAIAARVLGPADYGRMYLATTYATFAFLFVEWGQSATLTGKVATHRERAGELLGSGLVWRLAAVLLVSVMLPGVCILAGYDRAFILILLLTLLITTLTTVASACQDVFRGFERTDFAAASYVGWQALSALVSVPTLLLGGGLRALLSAQAVCAAAASAFVIKMLPRMQVPKLAVRVATLKELFWAGRAFLALGVVLALQPMVDVAMLSRFGSAEAMGWHAAARKLVGVLVYPGSALMVALYPTLCRLHKEDTGEFRKTASTAFHLVSVVVIPIALACALFPDLGIMIFSRQSYGPAQDNLRVLAVYVLLVYFSMPIGACLASTGRQGAWAVLQGSCVLISAVFDPPLIGWFQAHWGNGGLGVCVSTAASEILMVGGGLYLLPTGILDKDLVRKLAAAILSGGAMALVAWLSVPLDSWARAPLAVSAYVVCLRCSGAVSWTGLRSMLGFVRRR